MRKSLLSILFLVALGATASARDYEGRVRWSQANVDALHRADRAAVFKFINDTRPQGSFPLASPISVGEFGWLKVGGGKSDFAVLIDESERGYFNELDIYSRASGDGLKIQEIEGRWVLSRKRFETSTATGWTNWSSRRNSGEAPGSPPPLRPVGRQSTGSRTEDTLKTAAIFPLSMTTRSCPALIRKSAMPKSGSPWSRSRRKRSQLRKRRGTRSCAYWAATRWRDLTRRISG